MKSLLVAIAILFTFANMAGGVLANSHRYVTSHHAPIHVLNHVDENNRSIPVIVAVQPCGEIDLGDGFTLPCHNHLAVALSLPELPRVDQADDYSLLADASTRQWTRLRILRPPRLA